MDWVVRSRPPWRLLFRLKPNVEGLDGGGLLSVTSFHNQVWSVAFDRAGIRKRPLKILRAFAASLWLDAGAHIEYVRGQLGHADLRTTQKYLDVFRSRRESITYRIDQRIQANPHVGLVWGWDASPDSKQKTPRRDVA